eukprot:TRINITY_DN6632_c0_g1_i7.p1 TRINITY_DN6632_c0_g1~~TRINITY_DN6632_c0_g1_i7.p1  ORF type:complete len:284 (-),score=-1.32 TRINITY_DN6632_c0_g1_i7:110-961(-)
MLTNVGEFSMEDWLLLSKNGSRSNMRFFELSGRFWNDIPACLNEFKWEQKHFTIGYKQMIRFYSIVIYDLLPRLGYDYVMRMDDESLIHTEIKYNVFDRMRNENKTFGCRVISAECSEGLVANSVLRYLRDGGYENEVKRFWDNRLHSMFRERRAGCYNNWYVTKIAFWNQPEVRRLNEYIDVVGKSFTRRVNDICTGAAVMRAFLPDNGFLFFDDFAYEHCSRNNNGITWGGLILPRNVNLPSLDPIINVFRQQSGAPECRGLCCLKPFECCFNLDEQCQLS